jgi:N-acetylmuramic acid 6-phosphate (MurNAc-6-P) etherase
MMTLEEIKTQLQDRRVDIVAQATGLHYNSVQRIRSGANSNPSYNVMKLLSDYLEGKK